MDEKEQRYFWIKLSERFFQDDQIKLLMREENGEKYVIFLLRLMMKTIQHEDGAYPLFQYGDENTDPDDVYRQLSITTETDIDTVRSAISFFNKYHLLDTSLPNHLIIPMSLKMYGSETASAVRVRRHRERKKLSETQALQCNGASLQCNVDPRSKSKREEEESHPPDGVMTHPPSPEHIRQAEFIASNVEKLDAKVFTRKDRQKTIQAWAGDIEKLERLDGRSVDEITAVLNWAYQDDFWSTNILSGGKLRKQFSTLVIQMNGHKKNGGLPERPHKRKKCTVCGEYENSNSKTCMSCHGQLEVVSA